MYNALYLSSSERAAQGSSHGVAAAREEPFPPSISSYTKVRIYLVALPLTR